MNPLVSVIIPAYNAENFISHTIESVLNQDYKNFELIIINDGSTDNTSGIVNGYLLKDKRIKFFEQSNSGRSAARNYGIKSA